MISIGRPGGDRPRRREHGCVLDRLSENSLRVLERRRASFRALRKALILIGTASAIVVVASGFVMWGIDHDNYPNPWIGMWWGVQTITTIGYGDIVPTTLVGRIVASFVMILGVAFVSILTALIVSDLVVRREAEQEEEHEADELDIAAAIRRLDARLERIEASLRK
jgi:voltage-gated potassium channel